MDASSLDALVRIASAGTAGICVLIVFLSGFLIWKLPDTGAESKISLIKMYMFVCIGLALLSSASGIANFLLKQEDIDQANIEKTAAVNEKKEISSFVAMELPKIQKMSEDLEKTQELVKENPGRDREINQETKATLDSAAQTFKTIDFDRLTKIVKPSNKLMIRKP